MWPRPARHPELPALHRRGLIQACPNQNRPQNLWGHAENIADVSSKNGQDVEMVTVALSQVWGLLSEGRALPNARPWAATPQPGPLLLSELRSLEGVTEPGLGGRTWGLVCTSGAWATPPTALWLQPLLWTLKGWPGSESRAASAQSFRESGVRLWGHGGLFCLPSCSALGWARGAEVRGSRLGAWLFLEGMSQTKAPR